MSSTLQILLIALKKTNQLYHIQQKQVKINRIFTNHTD